MPTAQDISEMPGFERSEFREELLCHGIGTVVLVALEKVLTVAHQRLIHNMLLEDKLLWLCSNYQ